MKIHCTHQRNQAMTLIEAVVVIFIIAFLALIFLPGTYSGPRRQAYRISCINNQKQLVLAYKIWAGDNNGMYPMEVSVTNGGAMELMTTSDAWKAFQVMSNELNTTKLLVCPVIAEQMKFNNWFATNWGDDLKMKISYFIGLDATETNPAAILSGDGNFLLNNAPANYGFVNVATNASLTWDATRHVGESKQGWFTKTKTGAGNIGLADGSVQSLSNARLAEQLLKTGFATNRFFIP